VGPRSVIPVGPNDDPPTLGTIRYMSNAFSAFWWRLGLPPVPFFPPPTCFVLFMFWGFYLLVVREGGKGGRAGEEGGWSPTTG
jgi:hypothetical protein